MHALTDIHCKTYAKSLGKTVWQEAHFCLYLVNNPANCGEATVSSWKEEQIFHLRFRNTYPAIMFYFSHYVSFDFTI
jgi:hypothetical protein